MRNGIVSQGFQHLRWWVVGITESEDLNMTVEVALLISVVSVVFSIYFGLKNNRRTDSKEIEERVKENTRINMKLDETINISKETRNEISKIREDINKHDNRLVKVEESAKQAHHRLDTIENRLNGRGGNE